MKPAWFRPIFLTALAASGAAGLVYELTWTRLLTLYLGHTVAAASTVAAAFMGGLAGGALLAGRWCQDFGIRRALRTYAALEATVILFALALPHGVGFSIPWLAFAYQDGAAGIGFSLARAGVCFAAVLAPALALGASYPVAVRAFAGDGVHPGRGGGAVYAANTIGAAVGALAGGFVLLPSVGLSHATSMAACASASAAAAALWLARGAGDPDPMTTGPLPDAGRSRTRSRSHATAAPAARPAVAGGPALASIALAISGFASLAFEIAWVRLLSLLTGPTTYAFASALVTVIAGSALGAAAGAWLAGRTDRPALWLSISLVVASVATSWSTMVIGRDVPVWLMEAAPRATSFPGGAVALNTILVALLMVPAALALGAGFSLALELVGGGPGTTRRVAMAYGVNTIAALGGSLAAGFVLVPTLSLHPTLRLVSGLLLLAALVPLAARPGISFRWRATLVAAVALASVPALRPAPWDRSLLASGLYKYGREMPAGIDRRLLLTAGDLLYYRDGAAATVSVKELTGTLSLSIDGKVDASSWGDMLTQKLLAHLPLLLHPNPRSALVIGLGSGVTAASALTHGLDRLDVLEISPEVVEASALFHAQNRGVLMDPRTRLITGDGRMHLLLSRRQYDVIVSEPSNPWMAGVAALFTREFFEAARGRLAPGGVICQWAHTYDISDADLRSIAATFQSVFPSGTLWLVGDSDLLLIASDAPLDSRLDGIGTTWRRPGVADDLAEVSVEQPFALLSQYAGGPAELRRLAGSAPLQTDDRLSLEFTGPAAINAGLGRGDGPGIRELLPPGGGPPAIRLALTRATGTDWQSRARMLLETGDYEGALRDFMRALDLDPRDEATLDGLVVAAGVTSREAEAVDRLKTLIAHHPDRAAPRVAASRLLASAGLIEEAVAVLDPGVAGADDEAKLVEQAASIFADAGDLPRLDLAAGRLRQLRPDAPRTIYFAAAAEFLRGRFDAASALAERVLAAEPGYAPAHTLLGACRASLGRTDLARRAFLDALARSPRDLATYVNLGRLDLAEGNREAATRYFAEALTLDPMSESARQGLARARAE